MKALYEQQVLGEGWVIMKVAVKVICRAAGQGVVRAAEGY